LEFIPSIYTKESQIYLAAYYKNFQIIKIPINITKGSSNIIETPSYDLKLNAYGKTNNSSVKDQWEF
jgi:NADPH-dependent 7-cyano-7-deazaguanine reductase QueF-like protein